MNGSATATTPSSNHSIPKHKCSNNREEKNSSNCCNDAPPPNERISQHPQHPQHPQHSQHDNSNPTHHAQAHQHHHAAIAVKEWAKKIPIGLGLCPWAAKSYNKGLLHVVTCECDTPEDATIVLQREIELLTEEETTASSPPPLSTTLLVCPYVKSWEDFDTFDSFLRTGIIMQQQNQPNQQQINLDNVTLVAFHPNFLRWRGLPSNIDVGTVVRSHYGPLGRKSNTAAVATVMETNTKPFGRRRAKLRFHDNHDGGGDVAEGLVRREQYVPVDWIVIDNSSLGESGIDSTIGGSSSGGVRELVVGPPLPDNAMHRAPHPTIHIIANRDLSSLCVRDVSRVKRLNAERMAKLGWEGLEGRSRSSGDK